MKKRLEAELISIAHRILKLKGKEDLFQIHAETQKLYELLSVLKFAEVNYNIIQPKMDLIDLDEKLEISLDNFQKYEVVSEKVNQKVIVPDNFFTETYKEPIFEKIDDLKHEIESIEAEIENIEAEIEFIEGKISETNINFDDIEEFDEDSDSEIINTNIVLIDKPVGVFNISLNDRIGFVQRLFDNNNEDYNRVLSQLSTFDSYAEAKDFITNIVKPDYDDWNGNEDFEERFMMIVAKKFNS